MPEEFADEISLVGPPERIRKRRVAWEESPVTTLMVSGSSKDQLRLARDLLSD